MKKIKLNVASMNATEILSRDQLKSIFGGGSHEGTGGSCCYSYYMDVTIFVKICDQSKTEAQEGAAYIHNKFGYQTWWCCESC